jgi:hypothetical protein
MRGIWEALSDMDWASVRDPIDDIWEVAWRSRARVRGSRSAQHTQAHTTASRRATWLRPSGGLANIDGGARVCGGETVQSCHWH